MQDSWTRRVQLFTGWFTLFIIGTDLFVVSPLLPPIAEQFHIDASKAGWMVTAFSLMYALGAPWFGTLSDKWGRRKMIVIGLTGFAVANVITGVAGSFFWLIVSRMLTGVSASMITSSVFAVIGDAAPTGKGGRWLAIATSGFLTALWTGAPLGTISGQLFGWRTTFFGLAVLSLFLIPLNTRVWQNNPVQKQTQAKPATSKSLRQVLLDVVVTMFWASAVYGLYTYLGTGLKSVNDFSQGLVATSLVVYGIGAIAGSLSGGRLADKWNAQSVSILSLGVLAVTLIMIGLLFSGIWIWVLLAVWAFTGYVSFSSFQARLAIRFPDRLGAAMAWNQTAMYAGITIGSVFGGWVLGKWPFPVLPILCGVFALLGTIWFYVRIKVTDK